MSDPRATYTEAERQHAEARDAAHRTSLAVSTLRLLTFLGILAALVAWALLEGAAELPAKLATGVLTVLFLALVARHRRVRAEERRHEVFRTLAAEGLLRLDRRWKALEEALPEVEARPWSVPEGHAYGVDVDVFGTASLARLAGPVTSAPGRETLRAWLLAPAVSEEVRRRQEAVAELTPQRELRAELSARGRLAAPSEEEALEAFLTWAEEEPWLASRRWTRVAAWVLPLVTLGLASFELPASGLSWWLVPFALQLWLLGRLRGRIVQDFAVVEEGAPSIQAAGPQLGILEDASWKAELLVELKARLTTTGDPAHHALERLTRLADFVTSRRNLIYAGTVVLFLSDVHLAFALDRWRSRWGKDVRRWLDAMGEVEALSALATLGHDHPDWTFPAWGEGEATGDAGDRNGEGAERAEGAEGTGEGARVFRAHALGHPLLPPVSCVRNDVDIGPPGTFLFITGSNMSGKSTLMRAVGTNLVLAGAGATVCASRLSTPRVRLWTSMRVDDSLADGVSRFMAELLRVRSVVQAARDGGPGEPPVLFLLDEMLQGTNTAERRVAERAVLRHLLAEGAVGGVTSHDLTLADAPDLKTARRPFHFREHVDPGVEGTRLRFDYVLRPGVATTRNALRLLEAVGLGHGVSDDDDEAMGDDVDGEGGGPDGAGDIEEAT